MPNLRQYCVNIPEGAQPILHNCYFTNTSFCKATILLLLYFDFFLGGSCIYVHGKDANPVISHCTIANANNVGIFVDDHARVYNSLIYALQLMVVFHIGTL